MNPDQFNEPWTVADGSITDTNGHSIYSEPECCEEGYGFEEPEYLSRAALCVNACAGLSAETLASSPISVTPDISKMSPDDMRDILMDPARQLFEQDEVFRLQLLAMLPIGGH